MGRAKRRHTVGGNPKTWTLCYGFYYGESLRLWDSLPRFKGKALGRVGEE